jgi:hypothetical protein
MSRLGVREHEIEEMLPAFKPEVLGQCENILEKALAGSSQVTNLLV